MINGDNMNKLYMGIDTGSDMTKGIIIDEYDNIMASEIVETKGMPIDATKEVIKKMREEIDLNKYQVVSLGVTGASKKLIGMMLNANVIKNEILSLTIGAYRLFPEVKTIMEIGSEDSKVIMVDHGVVSDYEVCHMCATSTGTFISNMAKKLNYSLDELGDLSMAQTISNKCAVFAEGELLQKISQGYKKEDIMAMVCKMMVDNYVNVVLKNQQVDAPVVFTGGVSKNRAICRYLSEKIGCNVNVLKNTMYVLALGVAIIARESREENVFSFDVENIKMETRIVKCNKCGDSCEIVAVYKNNMLQDYWGNKCNKKDNMRKNLKFV